MIRDVIDRFGYRFELWRRERREEYVGPDEPVERDYISHFSKHPELVTESTFVSIGRRTAYFCTTALVAYVCFWLGRFFPALRVAIGVVFVVFVCVWTLGAIWFEIDLRRARKQYREREANKSSNQAMQLTAGRSESSVSVHESTFRPAMFRPRQR
jgi:uncharacterized membrane protein (DUF485 family)